MSPYQPLEPQGEQGAEEEEDPDHGADDEAQPEDPRLGLGGSRAARGGLRGTEQPSGLASTSEGHPLALQCRPAPPAPSPGAPRERRCCSTPGCRQHLLPEPTFLASKTQWLLPSSSIWFHHRRPTRSLPVTF